MRRLALAVVFVASGAAASGQQERAAEAPAGQNPAWEFSASLYGFFPPEDRHYAQPTVTADRGALHLEARYNYEGDRAGSAWVGWNLGFGEKLRLDATLMVGGVVGDTRGVAPGYELTLSWGPLELYSEGEWVYDTQNSDDSYFYSWSQLGVTPFHWLTAGLAAQRTRVYQTGLDVQRGFFVEFHYESLTLGTYVFNPGWETPTVVAMLSASF